MPLLVHLLLQSILIARFGAEDCDRSTLKIDLSAAEISRRCENGRAGECSAVPNHYKQSGDKQYQLVYVFKKDSQNACLDLKRLYFSWKMQENVGDDPRASSEVISALSTCFANCNASENQEAVDSKLTIRFLPNMCSLGYIIDETPNSIDEELSRANKIKLISEDSKKHCDKYYEILDKIRELVKDQGKSLEADIVKECGLACGELSSGAIAAIVIATFIIVGVAGAACCFFIKQRSSQ